MLLEIRLPCSLLGHNGNQPLNGNDLFKLEEYQAIGRYYEFVI